MHAPEWFSPLIHQLTTPRRLEYRAEQRHRDREWNGGLSILRNRGYFACDSAIFVAVNGIATIFSSKCSRQTSKGQGFLVRDDSSLTRNSRRCSASFWVTGTVLSALWNRWTYRQAVIMRLKPHSIFRIVLITSPLFWVLKVTLLWFKGIDNFSFLSHLFRII